MITENNYKYLKAPTIEQIDAVVKKAGISEYQFERYNGMAKNTIKHARSGFRSLPSKYWSIFFEPVKRSGYKLVHSKPQNKPKSKPPMRKTNSLSSLVS